MLKVDDVKVYDITTPLAKKDANINSTSTDAYTWVSGNPAKPFSTISAYVYQGEEGVMLWAPTTGAATSSVHRTRTELKGKAYNLSDDEIHKFTVKSKLHKINWFGSIVVMQMHCGDNGNDPTDKTFLTRNAKTGVYQLLNGMRTTASTADPKKELLLDNVDITKAFFIKYTITQGGLYTIDASQGDNVGKIEKQLDEARAARSAVFHLGVYNQQDMNDVSEPVGDGTLIELMEFSEYHGDIPVVVVPRTLQDILSDVNTALAAFKDASVSKDDSNTSLNALKAEADTFADSEERTSVYKAITDALAVVNYVEPIPVLKTLAEHSAEVQAAVDQFKLDGLRYPAEDRITAVKTAIDVAANYPSSAEKKALYTQITEARTLIRTPPIVIPVRTLENINNDVSTVLSDFSAGTLVVADANIRLDALRNEAIGFADNAATLARIDEVQAIVNTPPVIPRTLEDVAYDVSMTLEGWKDASVTEENALVSLNTLKTEVGGFPESEQRASVYAMIESAIAEITYIAPDEYQLLQVELDELEAQYRLRLKSLQSEMKASLNGMTVRMKVMSDKTRLAPLYTEITAFKADMTNGLVQTTNPV